MIRALFVQPQPVRSTSSVYLWPFLHTTMGHYNYQAIAAELCCLTIPVKSSFAPLTVPSLVRLQPARAFVSEVRVNFDVHNNDATGELGVLCNVSKPAVACNMKESKETQRRLRIGLANKGKVPWNKGKKHSPETCIRIKERTLEAMRDPKVREKMSQTSRLHSEQSKRKIGSSLKKLWAERLKVKHSKDMFYSSWVESIAEAARRGGIGEEQLDWDSYERLKVEIAFQRIQLEEEKVKEKKRKKIQTEKKAQERKNKQNAESKGRRKNLLNSERRKDKGRLAASRESSITDRVTKILEKKSADGPPSAGAMIYLQSALEKFDIESIKAERRRSAVSLADQIQAAKSRRSQIVTNGSSPESGTSHRLLSL